MIIHLACAYGAFPGRLDLALSRVSGDHVFGYLALSLSVHDDHTEFQFPFVFLGWNLLVFVNEVTAMLQESRSGRVDLINSAEEILLRLMVPEDAESAIVIGGRVDLPGWEDLPDLQVFSGRPFRGGFSVSFAGLEAPRSILSDRASSPAVLTGRRRYGTRGPARPIWS
jgi:hypothetical protein